MFKKFEESDLFVNRIEAHPRVSFYINSGSNGNYYFNKRQTNNVPSGSTYIQNISGSYSFITKGGTLSSFKTVSLQDFNEFSYGDIISSSNKPLTSSISSEYYPANEARPRIEALKNTYNHYTARYSSHFAFSSSLGDKSSQDIRLISIPSIFYGSKIEKGSLSLKFYITGTLMSELNDINKNGNLVQIGPIGSPGSGNVAGVVHYKEGFITLTGSWDLHASHTEAYVPGSATLVPPRWKYFFPITTNSVNLVPSSNFSIDFNGTQYIPTITMLCHAGKGELNHSNNPTSIDHGQTDMIPFSGSTRFRERDNIALKNVVKTPYAETEAPFEKITYISRIALYDEDKNLIGVAKVATPVRKTEQDSYTFKLKWDLG